jgi:hypothetical protein
MHWPLKINIGYIPASCSNFVATNINVSPNIEHQLAVALVWRQLSSFWCSINLYCILIIMIMNIKLSLRITKHYAMKTCEEWMYRSTFLDFGTNGRWMVSFTPPSLQSRCWRSRWEKILDNRDSKSDSLVLQSITSRYTQMKYPGS